MLSSGTSYPASPATGDLFIAEADFLVGADTVPKGTIWTYDGTDWNDISRESQEFLAYMGALNAGVITASTRFLQHNGTAVESASISVLLTYMQDNLNFTAGSITQADIDAAVAVETQNRADADSALSTRITDEVTARREGDNTLSGRIDAIEATTGEVNVQSDWDETDNTSDAFIQNKPGIAQADWDELDDTDPAYIRNKPTSLGGGGGGLTQSQVDDRVAAGVQDWAETGNTDIIPSTKLPAAAQQRTDDAVRNLARETVADWAETDNTDRAPLGKMTAGIVIDAQPEVDTGRIRLRLTRTGGTGQSIANTVWVDLPTGSGGGVDFDLSPFTEHITSSTVDTTVTPGAYGMMMPLATLFGEGFTGFVHGTLFVLRLAAGTEYAQTPEDPPNVDYIQQIFIHQSAATIAVRERSHGGVWSDWSVNAPFEDDITGISINGSTITATRRNGDTVDISLPAAKPVSPVLSQWDGSTDPISSVQHGVEPEAPASLGTLVTPYDAANQRWILHNGLGGGLANERGLVWDDPSINWKRFVVSFDYELISVGSGNEQGGFWLASNREDYNLGAPSSGTTGFGFFFDNRQTYYRLCVNAAYAGVHSNFFNPNTAGRVTLYNGSTIDDNNCIRIPRTATRNRWTIVRNERTMMLYLNQVLQATYHLSGAENNIGTVSGESHIGFRGAAFQPGFAYLYNFVIGFPSIEMQDPEVAIDGADIVDIDIDHPQNFNLRATRKNGTTKTIDLGEFVTNVSISGNTLTVSKKGTSSTSTALTLPSGAGGGSATFSGLTDTPSSIEGGKYVRGNSGGTALEFVDAPSGGGGEENVQSDWSVTDADSDAFIVNKPIIPPTPADWARSGNTNAIPRTKITDASILRMENLEYDPNNHELTIIQRRADGGLNEPTIDLSGLAGGGGGDPAWADITGKPSLIGDLTQPTTALPRNIPVTVEGGTDHILRLGSFSLYRGDWSSETAYQKGDIVTDAGFDFICTASTVSPTSNHPSNDTSNWHLMNAHSGVLWEGNIPFDNSSFSDAGGSSTAPSHIGAIAIPGTGSSDYLYWRDMGGFKRALMFVVEVQIGTWGNHWLEFHGLVKNVSEGNNLSYFANNGQVTSGSVLVLWAQLTDDNGARFRLRFKMHANGVGSQYRIRRISFY